MSQNTQNRPEVERQILARVSRADFVGRSAEVEKIIDLAHEREFSAGILVATEPGVGASELLRQCYDKIFEFRDNTVPIYVSLAGGDRTPTLAAKHFLYTALVHYIAHRRNNPNLCRAVLAASDLLELALPADAEWIERALHSTERERTTKDESSFVRSCISVLRRMREAGTRPFLLLDDIHVSDELTGEISLASEFTRASLSFGCSFVASGLRRVVANQFTECTELVNNSILLRLDHLETVDALQLTQNAAHRLGVPLNDETRDLIAQELGGKPFLISSFLHAAAENSVPLTSFRECQQLYLRELMGGRINRYYSSLFETLSVSPPVRRNLIKLLFESRLIDNGKTAVDVLRARLEVEASVAHEIVKRLNALELVNISSNSIEVSAHPLPWVDYLHTRYRLEVANEPRALVFADSLLDVLKRAPQTMARNYRREASLGVKDTLSKFNCQRIPASLLHNDRFKDAYKGAHDDEVAAGIDAEAELIRLPQIVHVANCAAFDPLIRKYCDEERCAVAHGFEAGNYSDSNEVIWLAVEIDSKLEAALGVAEAWSDRLHALARSCGFSRVKLWLVAPEGFSEEALSVLNERNIYSSSRQQFELLSARIDSIVFSRRESAIIDEFEMVIPMGDDTELIAANTVEQIARRLDFDPESINQIKTALVEACINASEHSLSPDRKIYQQFRLESDKLVITVSSRGVVPSSGQTQPIVQNRSSANGESDPTANRRGWGLQLIQSLMDEVEFESVDDGTRLRMTKYLRSSQAGTVQNA